MPLSRLTLAPSDLTAVIDTREQCPLALAPLRIEAGTLPTGDYSLRGLEHEVVVERKSLPDFVACCGKERERFEKEVQRLLAYPSRLLVLETTLGAIELGMWRSQLKPSHVIGSMMSWIAQGLPIFLTGDHATAGVYVSRFLYVAARRRWRELQSFRTTLKIAT